MIDKKVKVMRINNTIEKSGIEVEERNRVVPRGESEAGETFLRLADLNMFEG